MSPGFPLGPCPWYTARDGTPQAKDLPALASPQSVSRSASWQGSGAGTHNARPAAGAVVGGGTADMRRPKRIRREFPSQFSRAFGPHGDRFGQNAGENLPALGIPAGRHALYGKGPFLTQGMLRPPGNRTGKTRPTRGLRRTGAFREQIRRTGGGRACASVFREDGAPKDGDDLNVVPEVYLSPWVVLSAGRGRWRPRGWEMRGCGTQGSRYFGHEGQDPGSRRLGKHASVRARAS